MTPTIRESDEGETVSVAGFERRTGNKVAIYALLLAAVVNIVTVVWFAASLSAAVENSADADRARDATTTALGAQVAAIAQQLAVISDRVMREDRR